MNAEQTTSTQSRPSDNKATLRHGDLIDCYRSSGQTMATAYVPMISDRADALHRFETRIKNLRTDLAAKGAGDALVDQVIGSVEAHEHDDGASLLIVANETATLIDAGLERPVARLLTSIGPTPFLLPALSSVQSDEPHLAVLLDRTGADVYQRDGVGDPLHSMEVDGDDERVHRGHPGGWSQRRFQQTAENAWENNAKDVIEAIIDVYGRETPMMIAGDERAVGFFRTHLPTSIEAVTVEGSRHADHEGFLDAADEALRTRAADRIVDELDRFRSRLGSGTASTGLAVLDDLTQGRVDRLLVGNDAQRSDRSMGHFDFAMPAYRDGDQTATEAPIADGAVALAAMTGASVMVVPGSVAGMEEGLGAILRFD